MCLNTTAAGRCACCHSELGTNCQSLCRWMAAGERAAFFLGPVPEDKLPKDATPGGEGGRCLPACSVLSCCLLQSLLLCLCFLL